MCHNIRCDSYNYSSFSVRDFKWSKCDEEYMVDCRESSRCRRRTSPWSSLSRLWRRNGWDLKFGCIYTRFWLILLLTCVSKQVCGMRWCTCAGARDVWRGHSSHRVSCGEDHLCGWHATSTHNEQWCTCYHSLPQGTHRHTGMMTVNICS